MRLIVVSCRHVLKEPKVLLAAAALWLVLGVAACGDDEPQVAAPVQSPALSREPSSLVLNSETSPGPSNFEIWNSGVETLDWTVSEVHEWMSVSPSSGTSTGEHDVISVSIDWGKIGPGETKNGAVDITSNGGNSSVSVAAARLLAPVLSRAPDSLTFEYPAGPNGFEIWNSGVGTLDWAVSENENWMSVSPLSGASTGEHDPVSVTVDWDNIPLGESRDGDITITSSRGTSKVSVTASTPAVPILRWFPDFLTFDSAFSPGPKEFTIWNSGTGTLTWGVSESHDWMVVSPLSGSSAGEFDSVTVSVDWTRFSPGETKNGTIAITSNAGAFDLNVSAVRTSLLSVRDGVLVALETAYELMNFDLVDTLLDVNFTFFFSPEDVTTGRVMFANWNRTSELTATANLFGLSLPTSRVSSDGLITSFPSETTVEEATWGYIKALYFDNLLVEPVLSISLSLSYPAGENAWNPQIDDNVHPGEIWYEKTADCALVVRAGSMTFQNSTPLQASFVVRFAEVNGDSIYRIVSWRDDL